MTTSEEDYFIFFIHIEIVDGLPENCMGHAMKSSEKA